MLVKFKTFFLISFLKLFFFKGTKEGMVDYMIWPWFERFPVLKDFGNFEFDCKKFPKLAAWIERMKQLPAVQEVIIKPETYLKFFQGYLAGSVDYDFEE